MSVEIKCDRCGRPIERDDDGTYSSRVSNSNFEILRNGKLELHDLCDDCMWKLDVFMTGRMPALDYKPDELAYLELPNATVTVRDKAFSYLEPYERQITITGDLRPVEKVLLDGGIGGFDAVTLDSVILGVKLR